MKFFARFFILQKCQNHALSVEKNHGTHCTHEVDFLKKQNSVKIQLENLRTHKRGFMLSLRYVSFLHNC